MGLEKNARIYAGIPEDSPQDLKYCVMDKKAKHDAFIAGANWQKTKDQSTIELVEDHAMLAGMEKMKEEMMAKESMSCVLEWYDGFVLNFKEEQLNDVVTKNNINIGDKVKVIVIKED